MNYNFSFFNNEIKEKLYQFFLTIKKENEEIYIRCLNKNSSKKNVFKLNYTLNREKFNFMIENLQNAQLSNNSEIFFVVNNGGHKKKEIYSVSSFFIDIDIKNFNDTLKKKIYNLLLSCEIVPTYIVETKNGFHVYWVVKEEDRMFALKYFVFIQKKLIGYFNTLFKENISELKDADVNVVDNLYDTTRILRIPYFYHLKDLKEPFLTFIKFENRNKIYSLSEMFKFIEKIKEIDKQEEKQKVEKKEEQKKKEDFTIQVNFLKNKPKVQPTTVSNYYDLLTFLRQQDIRLALNLDVELNTFFNCILHDDKEPSAVIKKNSKNEFKYFCYGNCNFRNTKKGLDIIDLTRIILKTNYSNAIKRLSEFYNVKITKNEFTLKEIDKYIQNLTLITNDTSYLKEYYPNTYKRIKYGLIYLKEIIILAMVNLRDENYSIDDNALFYFSNKYLANIVRKDIEKTNKYINMLCMLGFLNKIDEQRISPNILKNAVSFSKYSNFISFYTMPNFYDILDQAEEVAIELKNFGYSIKDQSKKITNNMFGKEMLKKVYKEEELNLTPLEKKLLNNIFYFYEKNGYFSLSKWINTSTKIDNQKISKTLKEKVGTKLVPILVKQYNLKRKRPTKELYEKYDLDCYAFIWIRED